MYILRGCTEAEVIFSGYDHVVARSLCLQIAGAKTIICEKTSRVMHIQILLPSYIHAKKRTVEDIDIASTLPQRRTPVVIAAKCQVLRMALQESEWLAMQPATTVKRGAWLRGEQTRAARHMAGIFILPSSSALNSDDDDDAPGDTDAYAESSHRDPKGKRPARKW